ncbi:MAG: hypothetical protein R2708_05265 [Vicinamibacterales bacterium]
MRSLILLLAVVLAALPAPVAGRQPAAPPGVVVESIGPAWSGAQRAGLRPGDVLTAWALPATDAAGEHAIAGLADWLGSRSEYR